MNQVGSDALRMLGAAVERSKRTSTVELPVSFVRTHDGETPLKHIQQDGRGKGLRLRLFLSMLLMATRAPHKLRPHVAPAYARMLDLSDPAVEGARRVNGAQRWLAKNRYIARDTTQRPPAAQILRGDGSSKPWKISGKRWVTVPIELWQNGWIVVLSGRALTMYIVLRELTGGRARGASVPKRRRAEYGLSFDTWRRGCDELVDHGIAEVWTELVSDDEDWSAKIQRNVYRLVPDALNRPAPRK